MYAQIIAKLPTRLVLARDIALTIPNIIMKIRQKKIIILVIAIKKKEALFCD